MPTQTRNPEQEARKLQMAIYESRFPDTKKVSFNVGQEVHPLPIFARKGPESPPPLVQLRLFAYC